MAKKNIGAVTIREDLSEEIASLLNASQFTGKDLLKSVIVADRTDR